MGEHSRPRVLVVDDEESLRHVIAAVLGDEDCDCVTAGSGEDGLQLLDAGPPPDVALLDIVLPGMNGLDLLVEIRRRSPDTEVVMMTSHSTVDTAVRAIRDGAYDFLQKPFDDIDFVWLAVKRAYEKRRMLQRNQQLLDEQARRNQELVAAVTRLESLIDAGRAMAEFHSLPELLDHFTAVVARELEVDRISLMLLDPKTGMLHVASSCGLQDVDTEGIRVALGEGIAGRVAETGDSFLVTDVGRDPRIKSMEGASLSNSFISAPIVLSLPIKSQQRVLGVINVTNRRSGKQFDDADLAYLAGLSGQVAAAIDRASHFEDLQEAYDSLKTTQGQLVLSERIKAVGQTAAGVAHDFNNCLSVILTSTEIAAQELEKHDRDIGKIAERLAMIEKVSLQGAETIRRIQRFTDIRAAAPEAALEVSGVVQDALEMTRPKWKGECAIEGRQIEIRLDLADELRVSGGRYELTQAIGNLVFNAVDAMPDGGTLTLTTSARDGSVFIEVADTGVGMSQEVQDRLFDPFYTTKDDGHGLGTSIVRAIVGRHGGEVTVDSREGHGTRFTLRLPILEAFPEPPARPADKRASAESRPARLLIVDDEQAVLETWLEALQLAGQQVEACGSGHEALETLERARFDVLITDLSMPGMSGLELAAQARQVDPDLQIILLSGWALGHGHEGIRESGVDCVLAKPCRIEDLLQAVDRVLAATVAG